MPETVSNSQRRSDFLVAGNAADSILIETPYIRIQKAQAVNVASEPFKTDDLLLIKAERVKIIPAFHKRKETEAKKSSVKEPIVRTSVRKIEYENVIYIGEVHGEKEHGLGCYKYADESVYIGEFAHSNRKGKGFYRIRDEYTTFGEFSNEGLTHGVSICESNHSISIGHFENSCLEGWGISFYNGSAYIGPHKNHMPHGQGFNFSNGSVHIVERHEGYEVAPSFLSSVLALFGVESSVPSGHMAARILMNNDIYEGEVVEGKPHGLGVMIYANGDKHIGYWRNGKKHGFGCLIEKKSLGQDKAAEKERNIDNHRVGEWQNDHQVFSTHFLPNDGVYFGALKEANSAQMPVQILNNEISVGNCKLSLNDADSNTPQGINLESNSIEYTNGDLYQGQVHANGKPHGAGEMTYAEMRYLGNEVLSYNGDWKFGKRSGSGTMLFKNGDKYIGMWNNDEPNGKGICVFHEGGSYNGEWKNGLPHGYGTMHYASGDVYKGDWKYGKQHGQGEHSLKKDCLVMKGNFNRGNPHGSMIIEHLAGDFYAIEYKHGVLLKGKVCIEGESYQLEYKNGELTHEKLPVKSVDFSNTSSPMLEAEFVQESSTHVANTAGAVLSPANKSEKPVNEKVAKVKEPLTLEQLFSQLSTTTEEKGVDRIQKKIVRKLLSEFFHKAKPTEKAVLK